MLCTSTKLYEYQVFSLTCCFSQPHAFSENMQASTDLAHVIPAATDVEFGRGTVVSDPATALRAHPSLDSRPRPQPIMAVSDYDADATELLETYGAYVLRGLPTVGSHSSRLPHEVHNHRFGLYHKSDSSTSSSESLWQEKLALGRHACYTSSHIIPVSAIILDKEEA